jgi:uncharacterized protein DUF6884
MTGRLPSARRGIRPDAGQRLVIVGCSAEKAPCAGLLPAIELYDGGCVPQLRARLAASPALRARVRFLSAEHGLITADTPLAPYDRPLDSQRAAELRPQVWRQFAAELAAGDMPAEILVIAEPMYLVLLADLLAAAGRPRVHWIPDHDGGWPQAAVVLDGWGW